MTFLKNNSLSFTEGTIWKKMLLFFFPIFFGTLFQQLYNFADALIVGRYLGKQALAAVGGGTSTAVNLIIGFFVGLCSGYSVIIAQSFGAGDKERTSKAVHCTFASGLYGGIIISVAGYLSARPVLAAVGTPSDVMDMALSYMHIYFSGALFTLLYNVGSGILRAAGDSKTPLYSLITGCASNIVLDILFVGIFKFSIPGAAFATVISQFFSLMYILISLKKREDCCRLEIRKIRIDRKILYSSLAIGLPAGIQSVLYSVSNLVIQGGINIFGTDAAAAWAAYGRLDCLFWTIINAFGITITTFSGQNFGAGKIERTKKGVNTCLMLSFSVTAVLEILYMTFGRFCFSLFTSDENVIATGIKMMYGIVPFFFTYIPIEVLSGAIRGTGKTIIPSLLTLFGVCVFRVIWIASVSGEGTSIRLVTSCYPLSWGLTSVLFFIYYRIIMKQYRKQT